MKKDNDNKVLIKKVTKKDRIASDLFWKEVGSILEIGKIVDKGIMECCNRGRETLESYYCYVKSETASNNTLVSINDYDLVAGKVIPRYTVASANSYVVMKNLLALDGYNDTEILLIFNGLSSDYKASYNFKQGQVPTALEVMNTVNAELKKVNNNRIGGR